MNFIKKVFDKEIDNSVHLQFQKFSKGEFRDRAVVKVRKSKDKYTIVTSFEFANEMVRIVAEKLGDEKTNVKGAIVSTSDLTGKIDFKDKKQFQGVKRYLIESEMSGTEIIELLNNFPKTFFALSFEAGDSVLKIKPKAPKSSKSKNKEEKPNPDFCRLITTDQELGKSFVFEKQDFKSAEIVHHFLIERIEIPEELKQSTDFAKVREESKKVGKIIREAEIDEQEVNSEIEFKA